MLFLAKAYSSHAPNFGLVRFQEYHQGGKVARIPMVLEFE